MDQYKRDQYFDPYLIQKAMIVARDAHQGQLRSSSLKNQPLPYFMHLVDVVAHLHHAGAGQEFGPAVLIDAWLHDTVEDTKYTLIDVRRDFGPAIEHDVFLLTLPPTSAREPYKTPHQISVMESPDTSDLVRCVKVADKMSNTIDMVRYPPDWKLSSIQGYIASAAKVVGAAFGNSQGSKTLNELITRYWDEHNKVVQHFGVG